MIKKLFTTVLLTMAIGQLMAQETITFRDETFILDTAIQQKKNYKFIASDSIVLDTNFSRVSHTFPHSYYSTELVIDECGVYPPSAGLQGGPNGNDTGCVGSLGGAVDVGMMGGASYTIPLELPTGINGMNPKLALVYNSHSDNGMLGWKWDLSGLSAVTRTGKTRYHDGETGGVTLSETNDRFLLDGHRLIMVHDYNDSIEYKTEQDEMSRVVAHLINFGGGLRTILGFRVWKADGTIVEYGLSKESRIGTQNNRLNAICWLMNRILDRNGNAITYCYDVTQETGEFYISEINYTKNESLEIDAEFSVNFVYFNNEMADYDFKFVAGNIIQKKKLLKRIEIMRNGDKECVGKYSFVYDDVDSHELYDSVQMYHRLRKICYEKGGAALNPTKIDWTSEGDSAVMWKQRIYSPAIYDNFPFVGDFNGDGYSDLAVVPFKNDTLFYPSPVNVNFFLNNKDGGFFGGNIGMEAQPTKLDWIYVLDIDDDGYDDLVTFYYDTLPERSEIMVYRNTRIQDSICFLPVWNAPLWFNDNARVVIGDFEGQGRQSMLAYAIKSGDGTIANITYVHYNNGWCFTDHVDYSGDGVLMVHQTEPGDYDGDGKTELLLISRNESHVLKLTNNSQYLLEEMFRVPEITAEGGTGRNQVFSGDFNGDGLTDLLFYGSFDSNMTNTNGEGCYFMFSKATCFDGNLFSFELPRTLPSFELFSNSLWKILKDDGNNSWKSICTSDFDGDGITDVAVITNTTMGSHIDFYFKYKRDDGRFLANFMGGSYNGSHCGAYINCRTQYMHIGTFVNKECCSFLGLQKKEGFSVIERKPGMYALKPVGELNNVKSITDGLGNEVTFGYHMLMQPYQELNYGVRRIPVPIRVLDFTTSTNAADKPVSSVYTFTDPCYHRDGHGFIGFKQTSVTTRRNGLNFTKSIVDYGLETMNGHALLLPLQQMDSVYPTGNNMPALLTKTVLSFQKVVCSLDTLVTCPAVTKKEVWNYNVDNNSGGLLSKEIVEYDYNYTLDNLGKGLYLHSYDCTENRAGTHSTDVNTVNNCNFKTITTNVYDNVHPDIWILGRKAKQTITQSAVGKTDVIHTDLFDYASNSSYQLERWTDIPDVESSNDPLTLQTEYYYTATGNVCSEILSAPNGEFQEPMRRKLFGFGSDDKGRLMTTETIDASPIVQSNTYSYDMYDNLDVMVGYNGLSVSHDTDPLGVTTSTTNPDGTVTAQAMRWAFGMRFAPQNATYYRWTRSSGHAKQMVFYHKTGVELRTVDFGPNNEPIFIDKKYNDQGLLDSVSNPYFYGDTLLYWTRFEYDFLDRPVAVVTPDSVRTETTYQGLTTTTRVVAPNVPQRQSVCVSNVKGWTMSNCDPTNVTVNYDYYADGKPATIQTGNNADTRIVINYDSRGNRKDMTDPDYGKTRYTYNAYGELMHLITPKADEFTYAYDALGRLVEKQDSGENVTTSYSYNNIGRLNGTLNSITHGSQTILYDYDTLARPVQISEMLFGRCYELWMEYDAYSRVSSVIYPTGYEIQNGYSAFGHHISVSDGDGQLLWRADKTNANGQIVQATTGNGIQTNWLYDSRMHYLTGIETSNSLQSLHYDYDKFGNLAARTDLLRQMTETFEYDSLNRLTHVHFGQHHGQNSYDQLGRMTSKQALKAVDNTPTVQTVFSQPQFNSQKVHAVAEASVGAGWLDSGRFLATYTSFDKIKNASNSNTEISVSYGYDEQRIRVSELSRVVEREKTYALGCEFLSGALTEAVKSRTFLTCPTGVFALVEHQGGTDSLHYILKDHLGSWTVITDEVGAVEQELSYDAWGNLRNPGTWCVDATIRPMFDRGYTGHEHHVGLGLINMDGRMYDPVMSSFLSVDRYVQDPGNSQGFNRYAYCMYNPLRFTDPTGWQMIGGNKPRNPFHDDWSVSHSAPAHGPSAFVNAYNLVNMAMYGNLYGPNFPDMTAGGAFFGSWQGTYGYQTAYQSNSVYNYTFPSAKLQLIRNWQYSPSYRTNSDIRDAGITGLTVGVANYGNGYQKSYYTWTTSGKTYSTSALDYVGCSRMDYYSMTIQPLGWYGEGNRQLNTANLLAQSLGIPIGTIQNGMECAAKVYNNVSLLSGNLSKAQYVNALTKEGVGMLKAAKLAGRACFAVSAGAEVVQMYNYRNNGGQDYNVYYKGGLDIAMGVVGFLGPVGFGISMTYFVIDIATDGFNGWGEIQY